MFVEIDNIAYDICVKNPEEEGVILEDSDFIQFIEFGEIIIGKKDIIGLHPMDADDGYLETYEIIKNDDENETVIVLIRYWNERETRYQSIETKKMVTLYHQNRTEIIKNYNFRRIFK